MNTEEVHCISFVPMSLHKPLVNVPVSPVFFWLESFPKDGSSPPLNML